MTDDFVNHFRSSSLIQSVKVSKQAIQTLENTQTRQRGTIYIIAPSTSVTTGAPNRQRVCAPKNQSTAGSSTADFLPVRVTVGVPQPAPYHRDTSSPRPRQADNRIKFTQSR